jgi:hypothetical protein
LKNEDLQVKEVANALNLKAGEFLEMVGNSNSNIDYTKKNKKNVYEILLLGGVCKSFKMEVFELIKILELYQIMKENNKG